MPLDVNGREINSTDYEHSSEPNLNDLHKTMTYNLAGEPVIRTTVAGINIEGNVIVDKFLRSQDWRSGSALAIVGILFPVLLMVCVFLTIRIIKTVRAMRSRSASASHAREYWG